MKATIIIGTCTPGSRCAAIARRAEKKFRELACETSVFDLRELEINPCIGCNYCLSHQDECIFDDDMNEIYQEFREADILVFVSPVYFSNIPSILKTVIDRCQLFFNLKDKSILTPKRCLAIHIGGAGAYKTQFNAFKDTYHVLLPDLRGELNDFLTYSGSDKMSPLEDMSFLEKIDTCVERVVKIKN